MKRAKRILVGLKTLDSVEALVALACRLGAKDGSLQLVHVVELPDVTALDADVPGVEAEAAKIMAAAQRIARRSRMKASTLVLRAHDAGAALLDEMKEKKIDLAVIGYHHRRMLGEIVLGTTARHLAIKAPCHLVVSVPPRD